jgi:hypothetical protein
VSTALFDDAAYFDVGLGFAIAATLAGAALTAIVDKVSDYFDGDLVTQAPSARVLASAAPAAAPGQAFVADSVTYTVRQVLQLPPDGTVLRLVLARST